MRFVNFHILITKNISTDKDKKKRHDLLNSQLLSYATIAVQAQEYIASNNTTNRKEGGGEKDGSIKLLRCRFLFLLWQVPIKKKAHKISILEILNWIVSRVEGCKNSVYHQINLYKKSAR